MRVAGIVQDSIVDGPGLRCAIFVQGCRLHCDGCHNPDTWDEHGGIEMLLDDIISDIRSNPLTDGLTLTGGEPFDQAAGCISLAAAARAQGLNIWIFSGSTFEELLEKAKNDPETYQLLILSDVLVDGRFILSKRTLSRKWCGSENQRVIDVQKSLAAERAILYNPQSGGIA